MKALTISVFRSNLGDCSNGGVTGRYDQLYLACEKGPFDVPDNDERLMRIVVKRYGFGDHAHIEPVNRPEGMIGPMAGGCYAGSCDSRFANAVEEAIGVRFGVLPVHDRFETEREYRALSR